MSRPDTLAWFAGHELRLGWRDWVSLMTAGRRSRARTATIALIIFAAFMHLFAYWVVARYADANLSSDRATLVGITRRRPSAGDSRVAGCGERRPQPAAPLRQSWSRNLGS